MASDKLKKFAEKNPKASIGPHYVDLTSPDGKVSGAASHPGFRRTAVGNPGSGFGGANVIRTMAKPYHPLFSSPDRLQLPVQLAQINQYWRIYYNVDPVIGGVTDLHCLPGDQQLIANPEPRAIKDIKKGDWVYSPIGDYQPVIDTEVHPFDGNLHTLKASHILAFKCTDNHPIWVIGGERKSYRQKNPRYKYKRFSPSGPPTWKLTRDISKDDYLIIPKLKRVENYVQFDLASFISDEHKRTAWNIAEDKIFSNYHKDFKLNRYIPANEELAELLGWFVSEGDIGRGRTVRIGLDPDHNDQIKDIQRITLLFERLFGVIPKHVVGKEVIRTCLYSKLAAAFFEKLCGNGSYNKRIPDFVLFGTPEIVKAFLQSYIRGDGCFKLKYQVKAGTVSRTLAYQLQQICGKIGFLPGLTWDKSSGQYQIYIAKRAYCQFVLNQPYGECSTNPHYYEDDDYFYVRVKSNTAEHFSGPVYDIKTPTKGFCLPAVVHNSEMPWSGAFLTLDHTGDNAQEILHAYEDMLTETELLSWLPRLSKEFMIIGECFPFCFWDESEGIFSHLTMHNPDYCFPPGVYVSSREGSKPIEEVRVGDAVYTHTGKLQPVTKLSKRPYDGELVEIKLRGRPQPIMCTPNHLLLVGGQWTAAKDIQKTASLMAPHIGIDDKFAYFPIRSIRRIPYKGDVYNFEVERDHSYLVNNGIAVHNCEVIDSPLVDDEPILTLRPSQEMRRILQSTDPRYVRLRSKLPSDVLAMLVGGKNLPLDPLNASHLARRAFPYDIRGTSIFGRMFRILMYEDAVFSGQIAQAQRHALPLRVFKLGDPNTGWIPTPSNQEDFAELLAEAEVDPLAAIIYSYALQVEYHGMEGKQLKLTQEWDVIERAKMIAMGVSKAFLHGEVTYASLVQTGKVVLANGENIQLKDIKIGDLILDKDGIPRKVLDKWDEGVINPMYKIHLSGNKDITASDKHRWPVWVWPRTCACKCGNPVETGRIFIQNHYSKNVHTTTNSFTINTLNRCKICTHPRVTELHNDWLIARRDIKDICTEYFPGRTITGVKTSWQRHLRRHVTLQQTDAFKSTGARWTINRHQSMKEIPTDYEPYQTLPTKDLRIGDYLMIPRNFSEITPSQKISFARLLGYYIAEGWTSTSSCVQLSFNRNEWDTWVADTLVLADSLGFIASRWRESEEVANSEKARHTSRVRIGSGCAPLFATHGGRYSATKMLSEEVMGWPLDYKRELIKGMFRGDGSIQETIRFHKHRNKKYTQRHVDYRTTSEQLASQLELILAQLGYPCSRLVQKDGGIHDDGYTRQDLYHVNVYGDAACKIAKLVWNEDWPNIHEVSRQQPWVDDNYVYLPIEKIEEINNTENVIDITVEGSHSFLTENVGTYNSANAGLQVLMMRYRTFRDMIMNDWIYKKVFAVMAELRGFYRDVKKTDDEYGMPDTRNPAFERQTDLIKDKLRQIQGIEDPERKAYEFMKIQPLIDARNSEANRVYIPMTRLASRDRSKVKKKKLLLYPHLQFEKRLDIRQDEAILGFWADLASKGWISPRSVVQGAGLDYDAEMATISKDANKIVKNQLIMQSLGGEEGGAGGGGGMPMGGLGIGEAGGAGIGLPGSEGEPPSGGVGPGGGEGGGGAGSAGGNTPSASRREDRMKKVSLKDAPDVVKQEIEKLLSGPEPGPDFFIGK